MRLRTTAALLASLALAACGEDGAKTPADTDEDSGTADPCAGQADGTVVDEDPDAACGGFVHACDPTGEVVHQQVVCDGGASTVVPRAEACERDVVAESGCTVREGNVTVHGAEDLAALEGVDAIFGNLIVDTDDTSGLESLAYVSGAIGMGVRDLSALGGLSGLVATEGGLSLLCVTGGDLSMFAGLETIHGDLTVVGAPDLVQLTFPALTTLSGELELDWASDQACTGYARTLASLAEIGPFGPGLTEVGGVAVSSTRSLIELGALGDLTRVDGRVTILDNELLSECLVEDWLGGLDVTGEITVRNNADCQ